MRRWLWVRALQTHVYFGSDRLYRSTDRGDTMTVVSQAPHRRSVAHQYDRNLAKRRQRSRGRIAKRTGLGALQLARRRLVDLAPPIPANPNGSVTNKFIGRAMVDPNNKNIAYITLSYYAPAGQGIWKITNLVAAAGAAPATPVWAAAGNGIPSIPINAFAIDPSNSNNLYAGTDIGVYFSSDGGANWSPFGTGLPKVAVFDLQIQPTSRILRARYARPRRLGDCLWSAPRGFDDAIQSLARLSVTEGPVSATVTVTRSVMLTVPASVNYATADSSGSNGCGANHGCGFFALRLHRDFRHPGLRCR